MVDSINLLSLLRRHIQEKNLTQAAVAKEIGINGATLSLLLNNKQNPQKDTREKIEYYLRQNGVMSRLGFPTTPLPREDKQQLEQMGIQTPPPSLSEKEKRFIIYAFYHAHGSDSQKDALLDKIFNAFS